MSAKKLRNPISEHTAELTAIHKPSKAFSKKSRIGSMAAYEKLYKHSIDKPEIF